MLSLPHKQGKCIHVAALPSAEQCLSNHPDVFKILLLYIIILTDRLHAMKRLTMQGHNCYFCTTNDRISGRIALLLTLTITTLAFIIKLHVYWPLKTPYVC